MQTNDKTPIDFVAEAEKIIHEYKAKNQKLAVDSIQAFLTRPRPRVALYTPEPAAHPSIVDMASKQVIDKNKFRFDFLLYILMVVACIVLAAVVAFGLLN